MTHHRLKILSDVNFLQILELESLSVLLSDIVALSETVKVEDQMHQLFIALIIVEGDDWNAVVKLIPERVDSIVNDDNILQIAVGNDPQVLYVNSFLRSYAMLSIESVLN